MSTFDLVINEEAMVGRAATIDSGELRKQLEDLTGSLGPILDGHGALALESLVVGLTLTAAGRVAFIAEAGVEASITLTFSRPPTH